MESYDSYGKSGTMLASLWGSWSQMLRNSIISFLSNNWFSWIFSDFPVQYSQHEFPEQTSKVLQISPTPRELEDIKIKKGDIFEYITLSMQLRKGNLK